MIRLFLKRVDDYAMYGYGPPEYTVLDIENPQLEALLREKWWVLGAELIGGEREADHET